MSELIRRLYGGRGASAAAPGPPLRPRADAVDTAFAAAAPTHRETHAHIGGNEKMAGAYAAWRKAKRL